MINMNVSLISTQLEVDKMDLLPAEQAASDFVSKIGLPRAYQLINKLAKRFDRRYDRACKAAFTPINREWIRQTPFELELMHRLQIGVRINDDYFTPHAAKERILKRIAARKAKQQGIQNEQ